jgi:hypothetical protein
LVLVVQVASVMAQELKASIQFSIQSLQLVVDFVRAVWVVRGAAVVIHHQRPDLARRIKVLTAAAQLHQILIFQAGVGVRERSEQARGRVVTA